MFGVAVTAEDKLANSTKLVDSCADALASRVALHLRDPAQREHVVLRALAATGVTGRPAGYFEALRCTDLRAKPGVLRHPHAGP